MKHSQVISPLRDYHEGQPLAAGGKVRKESCSNLLWQVANLDGGRQISEGGEVSVHPGRAEQVNRIAGPESPELGRNSCGQLGVWTSGETFRRVILEVGAEAEGSEQATRTSKEDPFSQPRNDQQTKLRKPA